MALGRRLRVDLAQLKYMAHAASDPRVDHVDVLVDDCTDEVVSYLLVERAGDHWLPIRRRRDGALVDGGGEPIEYGEAA